MRRVAELLAAALVAGALTGTAAAQVAPNGAIRGRVTNGDSGEAQPNVRITLRSSGDDDASGRRTWRTTTDRGGRFEFPKLPTGEERVYLLDAHHDGGYFAGGVLSIPSQTSPPPVIDTTLRVWDTIADPSSILVRRDAMFVTPFEGDVSVVESVSVVNVSDLAYIGRGAGMGSASNRSGATLGVALPAGAERDVRIVDSSPMDIPEILGTDYGFATTVAIPPGETSVTFAYTVESDGGGSYDFSKTNLYPTSELSLFATEPLEVDSDRLRSDGRVRIGEDSYSKWTSRSRFDAGDRVAALVIAEGEGSMILLAGMVLFALALGGGLTLALLRRRRPAPAAETGREEKVAATREQLLIAIAELDIDYQGGGCSEDEWRRRRARLKRRLAGSESPVRAR